MNKVEEASLSKSEQKTIYEKLGGEKAINDAVEIFYEKVLSDPELMGFFSETNMEFQKKHQKDFITFITGGSKVYKGKDMRSAHKNLKIDEEHFNAIRDYLAETLKEMGVDNELVSKVTEAIEKLRPEILNR